MQCDQCSYVMPYDAELGVKYDCLFCEGTQLLSATDYLEHTELSIVTELRPAQLTLTNLIDQTLHNEHVACIEAGTGLGKCHARGQGVLLYSGRIKKVEDIIVGDRLMGPDSRPRTVCSTNQGHGPMYDIVPVKGTSWRVNGAHVLTVVFTDTSEVVDVDVHTYLDWVAKKKHRAKLFRATVNFKPAHALLPLDPYTLGLLLGDGCLGGKSDYGILFTTGDSELAAAMREYTDTVGLRLVVRTANPNCTDYRLSGSPKHPNPASTALKKLGLYGTNSGTKFIPHRYKVSSKKHRLALLAGLIDTDGSLAGAGFDYISKSKQLANDVAFLARSVGLAAYIRPCEKRDQNGQGGTYYRVGISGDCAVVPCRLPRKQAAPRRQKKNHLRTSFKVVPVTKEEDFFGFTLAGADARFLLDDFTVTHNSFSYLLPAILSGKRTLISTAKKSLQSQLLTKDLPYLQQKLKATQRSFTFAVAYGKSNYACMRAVKKATKKPEYHAVWDWFFTHAPSARWAEIQEALVIHRKTRTPRNMRLPVASKALSAQDCDTRTCAYKQECKYARDHIAMLAADVVVVNNWLLGYHLRLKRELGFLLLGPADYLVVDEAHKIEDGIRTAFTHEIRDTALTRIIKDFENINSTVSFPNKAKLERRWNALFRKVSAKTSTTLGDEGTFLEGEIDATLARFNAVLIAKVLNCPPAKCQRIIAGKNLIGFSPEESSAWTEIVDVKQRLQTFSQALNVATNDANSVVYVEDIGTHKAIRIAPVSVAQYLTDAHNMFQSSIYLSATLAVFNKMDSFKRRTGIMALDQAKVVTSQVGSAFNLQTQAALYLSKNVPQASRDKGVKQEEYRAALAKEILTLTSANKGNALVLFTARDEMLDVYDRIKSRSQEPVLVQSQDTTPAEVLHEYRKTPNAVLLGLASFREGIDIQGKKLSLVIITKLPFPNRSDPIVAARHIRAGTKWFQHVDLPDMLLDLRQSVGRLIRTKTDRGLVAILDPRLRTKSYGNQVIDTLGFRTFTNLNSAVATLKKLAARV